MPGECTAVSSSSQPVRTKRMVAIENCDDADRDEGMARAEAIGPRELREPRLRRLAERGGTGQGENEQVEPLDHEAEGDDCDPGAEPGEERPFVGGMV